jgi:hypothetical protein
MWVVAFRESSQVGQQRGQDVTVTAVTNLVTDATVLLQMKSC